MRTVRGVLGHRAFPVCASAFGFVLALPALWVGLVVDDHVHRLVLQEAWDFSATALSPSDLFAFLDGDASRTQRLRDLGVIPWWSIDGLRIAFWRPISSLSHSLDYWLWPDSPALMHLHSLIWFGALALLVGLLYRRLHVVPWVAGLAALLYAVDDARAIPVGWVANRNALLATCFGVACLIAHDRWRREGWRPGAVVGPGALGCGLLAGEMAVGSLPYLLAHALFLDEGHRKQRLLGLVPYVVMTGIWMAAYRAMGYGTWGSGYYIDPGTEPLWFAGAVMERFPILLLDQWALPPSGIAVFLSPDGLRALWIAGIVGTVVLAAIVLLLLRGSRLAGFWGSGMILSLVPACATVPNGRLLMFAGIGGMGLVAQVIAGDGEGTEARDNGRRRGILSRGLAGLFVVIHLVLAPVLLPFSVWNNAGSRPFVDVPADSAPMDASVVDDEVVIVNPPFPFFAHYLQTVRALKGGPIPGHVRVLAPGTRAVDVLRADERTLVITPERGFLSAPFDGLFRGDRYPVAPGDRVQLSGLTAEVLEATPSG
ncbi:MAG: hypothetical protein QGI83_22880, partial [Candidatus Latescibacteria bacterium]|nr:hypothetical protein [Candidatus Latescibacterota bacterium]